jgi:signal transduction histidine kinase
VVVGDADADDGHGVHSVEGPQAAPRTEIGPPGGAGSDRTGWRRGGVLALAALAVALLVGISELGHWRSTAALTQLQATEAARGQVERLLRRMIDAETGQRGYLLTANRDYLDPYGRAADDVVDALAALRTYYSGNQAALPVLDELETMALRKLSELDTTMRLFDEGKQEVWRNLLMTGIGKEQMEALRSAAGRLLTLERDKVDAGRRDLRSTLHGSRVGVAALALALLAGLALYLRQAAALAAERAALQRAVQAERDQLEIQVQHRTAELIELAQHLQTAREDERLRLARELHDELGALLTTAKLDAARLKSRLAGADLLERLAHLSDRLDAGIALKRRIIEDLRPSSLEHLGLAAALETLVQEFGVAAGVAVAHDLAPLTLPPAAELTAYRLVQEALTNVAKHAQAGRVEVTLAAVDGGARLVVQDDGCGFDPDAARRSAHGLVGMRYRVMADGGRLAVLAATGRGTRIEAWLPGRV